MSASAVMVPQQVCGECERISELIEGKFVCVDCLALRHELEVERVWHGMPRVDVGAAMYEGRPAPEPASLFSRMLLALAFMGSAALSGWVVVGCFHLGKHVIGWLCRNPL